MKRSMKKSRIERVRLDTKKDLSGHCSNDAMGVLFGILGMADKRDRAV